MNDWSLMKKLIYLRGSPAGGNQMGNADLTITADTAPAAVTCAKKSKVRSCAVSFGAYQAGSGDPSPENIRSIYGAQGMRLYVGGANQWDEEWELGGLAGGTGLPYNTNDRIRSKTFCKCAPNTTYYGHIGKSGAALIVWWYDNSQAFISGIDITNKTMTSPENAAYFKLSTYGGDYTTYLNDIAFNYPSSVTSYTPYRADTVSVTFPATGKNLWSFDDPTAEKGYYNLNGVFTQTNEYRCIGFSCAEGDQFTKSGTGWGGIVTFWNGSTFVSAINASTVTIPANVNIAKFACQTSGTDVQLERGGTATAYEPYNTVYSGTFDPVTGILTATHGHYKLASNAEMVLYQYGGMKGVSVYDVLSQSVSRASGYCSHTGHVGSYFDNNSIWCGVNNNNIYWIGIMDILGLSTLEQFKEWVDTQNVQIVYELKDPIPFTVPPQSMQPLPKGTSYAWAVMERDVT